MQCYSSGSAVDYLPVCSFIFILILGGQMQFDVYYDHTKFKICAAFCFTAFISLSVRLLVLSA